MITYVLDGGTQAANQVNYISSIDTVTLLEPTKEDYIFSGWFDNVDLEGESIEELSDVSSDITLYAGWRQFDYFVEDSQFNGQVSSVINTGVMLYSAENINKNFQIKFTVESYDSSYNDTSNINNSQPPTIISSMYEVSSPWPGLVFRLVTNGGATKYSMKINDSHVTSALQYYNLTTPFDVEIVRENGAIYTRINSDIYVKVLEYGESIDTFDVPLTIGGNIDSNGNYSRVFKGELSNVSVLLYTEPMLEDEYSYTETRTANSYNLHGTISFDGTNRIDTGINLFSAANINKDFDISLTLRHIGTNSNQATLINLKDESKDNVWPGVSYRVKTSTSMEFTARWPGQSAVTVLDNMNVPKHIKITRRSGVIYYSIDGAPETRLINVPPASFSGTFNSNLTFGASTNASGNPFRYFVGTVSNIDVNLYDN